MRNWVLGQPAPGAPPAVIERDDARRITRLQQDDWQVAFNYASAEATRPSRIDAAGNDAEIRFAIDDLTLLPP
jgi:outer membrane biogenesis lipoprotein LolB